MNHHRVHRVPRSSFKSFVIQNGTECSEESRKHKLMEKQVDAPEILPLDGRLDDTTKMKNKEIIRGICGE